MLTFLRRLFVVILGLVLVVGPTLARDLLLGYNERTYTPPDIPVISFAATPVPTPTPVAVGATTQETDDPLRPGPVVVDLAHFSFLNPSSFEPLADALATRGIGLRYWLSKVDPNTVENFLEFPDQSAELTAQLKDATALIAISPFFLWTPDEIKVVERFVADGGRLLLASDPDVMGDFAATTNFLAEPFGIVFNDDYLYDTANNDGNYTFFFQGEFSDQAADLADAKIAFYGGRSIGGDGITQVQSSATTLSSLRIGKTAFTTVAIGGQAGNNSTGRVLALSDIDVLTTPYLLRDDNRRMVDFVANFLSAERRIESVADFPGYLGKEVALAFGSTPAISADLLLQGAQLQRRLEENHRTLQLTGGPVLTNSLAANTSASLSSTVDLIYLGDYATTNAKTTLLADLGIEYNKEVFTPTLPVESETVLDKTSQPNAEAQAEEDESAAQVDIVSTTAVSDTSAVTVTTPLTKNSALTATIALTSTPPVAPTPIITFYLETGDGLRLLAEETVLVVQTKSEDRFVLAVLGFDATGIDAGIKRLLENDFSSCITGSKTTFCPVAGSKKGADATEAPPEESNKKGESEQTTEGDTDKKPSEPSAPTSGKILLVDDNRAQKEGDLSEADAYLKALTDAGYTPDLWSTAGNGAPTADDLASYGWVIWSNAGYASSVEPDDMEILFSYMGNGGNVTISSRRPLPGIEGESVLRDVVVNNDVPELVQGLPEDPITLEGDLPPVTSLSVEQGDETSQVALRQGPTSDKPDAPVMLVVATPLGEQAAPTRLIILGMSVGWLPQAEGDQLVQNMATWMLSE